MGHDKASEAGWYYHLVLKVSGCTGAAVLFIIAPYVRPLCSQGLWFELTCLVIGILILLISIPERVARVIAALLAAFNITSKTCSRETKHYTATPVHTNTPRQHWPSLTAIAAFYTEPWEVLSMTLDSLRAARDRYSAATGRESANIIVCDDGLMELADNDLKGFEEQINKKHCKELTEREKEFCSRMAYYRRYRIPVIARPRHNTHCEWGTFVRRGLFKKAGNLNHGIDLTRNFEHYNKYFHDTNAALKRARHVCVTSRDTGGQENVVPLFSDTAVLNEDALWLGDVLFFADKYTIASLNGFTRAMPEFIEYENLGFLQMGLYSNNEDKNYFTRAVSFGTKTMWKYSGSLDAHSGFPRFCGHSGFVRTDALIAAGGFDESYVSEDTELSLRIALTINPKSGKRYYGKFANYRFFCFEELIEMEGSILQNLQKKYTITDDMITNVMKKPLREVIDSANIWGVRKSLLLRLAGHKECLSRKQALAFLIHKEEQSRFSKGVPEGFNAEIVRSMKFTHGDAELVINPVSFWMKKGVFAPTAKRYLSAACIPWHAKAHLIIRYLTRGIALIYVVCLLLLGILFAAFGVDFFYRAQFFPLMILEVVLLSAGAAASFLYALRVFKEERLSVIEAVCDYCMRSQILWGLQQFLLFSSVRFLLGRARYFDATPVFRGKTGFFRYMDRIVSLRKNVFCFAAVLGGLYLISHIMHAEITLLTIILLYPVLLSCIITVMYPFIMEPH